MGNLPSMAGGERHSSVSFAQPAPVIQAATTTDPIATQFSLRPCIVESRITAKRRRRHKDIQPAIGSAEASEARLRFRFPIRALRARSMVPPGSQSAVVAGALPAHSRRLRGLIRSAVPRDLREQFEEAALALRTEAPVHRH